MSDINNDFDDIPGDAADAVLRDVLAKAGKSKDDDDDDDPGAKGDGYDEKYMKRHMSRYMKNNPTRTMKGSKVMKKAEELGEFYEELESETEGAQMISLDGTGFFKAFVDMGNELIESNKVVRKELAAISDRMDYNEQLQKAASAVILEDHEVISNFGSKPKERTSQALGGAEALALEPLQKAAQSQTPKVDEQYAGLLQKAMTMKTLDISRALQKAAIKDGVVINQDAAKVLSRFETGGGLVRLPKLDLQYVLDNVVSPINGGVQ